MADYAPVNGADMADTVTWTAGTAISGGQLLVLSAADQVSPSAANPANYVGVAAHDAASGAPVTVFTGSGVVHETVNLSGGAIAAGALLYAGAAASVTSTAGSGYGAVPIGVAVRAANNSTTLRWKSLIG